MIAIYDFTSDTCKEYHAVNKAASRLIRIIIGEDSTSQPNLQSALLALSKANKIRRARLYFPIHIRIAAIS